MGKGWAKNNYCDLIPDTLFNVYLGNCCYKHDVNYMEKYFTRKDADLRLVICVYNKYKEAGKPNLGKRVSRAMYFFLRKFGWIRW